MKTLTLLIALLVVAMSLSGCAKQDIPAASNTIAQSTTSATPAASTTPQTAEVTIPDDIVGENPDPGPLNDVAIDTRVLG
jgi:hypothetical protein